MALRGDDPPIVVIGELKLTFNLELVLQGVHRAAACDEVWLAARLSSRAKGRENDARFRNLCRRLGFGLLGVQTDGEVDVLVSPAATMPRRNPGRRSRLVEEHCSRRGDPVEGGGSRKPIMTAYRQRALACAAALAQGPRRPRDLKADIPDAPKILRGNVYGWFAPVERGVYTLAESGRAALLRWPQSAPPTVQHAPSLAYEERPQSKGFPVRSVIDSMPMKVPAPPSKQLNRQTRRRLSRRRLVAATVCYRS